MILQSEYLEKEDELEAKHGKDFFDKAYPSTNSKFAGGGETQGYADRQDESLGMRTGKESSKQQSDKARREDSYGKWGKRDSEKRGTSMAKGGSTSYAEDGDIGKAIGGRENVDEIYVEGKYPNGDEFYQTQSSKDADKVVNDWLENNRGLDSYIIFAKLNDGEEIEIQEFRNGGYYAGGGEILDDKNLKDFIVYRWSSKQAVWDDDSTLDTEENQELTEKEVVDIYLERMRRGYDYAVQIYEKGKKGRQIFRSESFDKAWEEKEAEMDGEDYYAGGGVVGICPKECGGWGLNLKW
jgi:hypothetical protein